MNKSQRSKLLQDNKEFACRLRRVEQLIETYSDNIQDSPFVMKDVILAYLSHLKDVVNGK